MQKDKAMNELIPKNKFIEVLKQLTVAKSLTGKDYSIQHVNSINVDLVRESGNSVKISVDELYSIYYNCSFINTNIVRSYITGRMFSPAVAILIASGFYDNSGHRNSTVETIEKTVPVPVTELPKTSETSKESDETRFFKALESLFPGYIISKSVNRTVSDKEVFLNDDYRLMELSKETENDFNIILMQLNSDFGFSGKSLSSYIDGCIYNHPVLGSRIVEFDEEQHFSPARLISLNAVNSDDCKFLSIYKTLLRKEDIYSSFLKKHRLKLSTNKLLSFDELIDEVNQTDGVTENGYIAPKNGFNYTGGRIAQRAYYDLLRDLAHLSAKNNLLKPILRFPKVLFEIKFKKPFSGLSEDEIKKHIISTLNTFYIIKA